jgi:lipid A 3-O-deacylase
MNVRLGLILLAALLPAFASAQIAPVPADSNVLDVASTHQPFEYGVVFQGGNGLTDMRGGYHFLWGGVQVGRVLTNNFGHGILRGNFEYGGQFFPYFQAFTPKFDRVSCRQAPVSGFISCSQPYQVGGTYSGISLTPIILRWNLARHGHWTYWGQAAGGVLWTNHKFPPYGNTSVNLAENGPNGETSVWNFTPQGGIGLHYFTKPHRSIDFSANATHISSASLGDRNPGVNASVQFTVGYTWWK